MAWFNVIEPYNEASALLQMYTHDPDLLYYTGHKRGALVDTAWFKGPNARDYGRLPYDPPGEHRSLPGMRASEYEWREYDSGVDALGPRPRNKNADELGLAGRPIRVGPSAVVGTDLGALNYWYGGFRDRIEHIGGDIAGGVGHFPHASNVPSVGYEKGNVPFRHHTYEEPRYAPVDFSYQRRGPPIRADTAVGYFETFVNAIHDAEEPRFDYGDVGDGTFMYLGVRGPLQGDNAVLAVTNNTWTRSSNAIKNVPFRGSQVLKSNKLR